MCRAGGRRCPNAGGRSTQNTRQAVSRARRALREAQEIGNPAAITTARQRLDTARTAHRHARENTVNQHHDHHHDEGQDHATAPATTAGEQGDVTDLANDTVRRADEAMRRARHISRSLRTHDRRTGGTDDADRPSGTDSRTTHSNPERNTVSRHRNEHQDQPADPTTTAGHHGDVTTDTTPNPDRTSRTTVRRVRHLVINGDFHAGPVYND